MELTEEQKQELSKAISSLVNAFKEVINAVYKVMKPLINWLVDMAKEVIKYKKYNMIYMRTKSKRIRKKQVTLIRKKVLDYETNN